MADGKNTAIAVELTSYLLSQIDNLSKIKDLMTKEGGATKEDVQALMDFHDSERKRIGDYIDSLPDTPAQPGTKAV